jgi:hypothetical protein
VSPLQIKPIATQTLDDWQREVQRALEELHGGCVGGATVALRLLSAQMREASR